MGAVCRGHCGRKIGIFRYGEKDRGVQEKVAERATVPKSAIRRGVAVGRLASSATEKGCGVQESVAERATVPKWVRFVGALRSEDWHLRILFS